MNDHTGTYERFAKIQALGNDFVWLLGPVVEIQTDPRRDMISFLSDDRVGIGADGVILWRPLTKRSADLWFYNRDGSEASVCGNGLRAVAEAGCELGYFEREDLSLRMWGTMYSTEFQREDGVWSVRLLPVDIDENKPEYTAVRRYLQQSGLRGGLVFMPNPHVVIVEERPGTTVSRGRIAADLNDRMDDGTNVGFYTHRSPGAGSLVVWERGVGWTPACGSGAAAALLVCNSVGMADERLIVRQPGGDVTVDRRSDGTVWITGPATLVYTGTILLSRRDRIQNISSGRERNVVASPVFDIR